MELDIELRQGGFSLEVSLALALGDGDFSVVYTRDAQQGAVTGIVLGLGDDFDALIRQSRR